MNKRTPEDAGHYLDEFDSDRFWPRVNFHGGQEYLSDPLSRLTASDGECWVWTAGTGRGEYGRFKIYGKTVAAHRISYRDFGNKLPDDLDVDHLCRNTTCVRPTHLEPVTKVENVARGMRGRAARTHCPSGHEYTVENTVLQTRDGRTHRYCRVCLAASRRRTYERAKRS